MMHVGSQLSNDTLREAAEDGRLYIDTYTGMKKVKALRLHGTSATVTTGAGIDRREWKTERRDLLVKSTK